MDNWVVADENGETKYVLVLELRERLRNRMKKTEVEGKSSIEE
jgi:hypothetical protein